MAQYDRRVVDSEAECCQLNLAHVARNKKKYKKKLKQIPVPTRLICYDPRRQSRRNQKDCGGKYLWKRLILSLEWSFKSTVVILSRGMILWTWHADCCRAGQVVAYKRLRGGVEILPEIPRSAAGKILRRQLKEMARSLTTDPSTFSAAMMEWVLSQWLADTVASVVMICSRWQCSRTSSIRSSLLVVSSLMWRLRWQRSVGRS